MCEVINIKDSDCSDYVYIGRHRDPEVGYWGNPYSSKSGTMAKYKTKSRQESIKKYETYLLNNKEMLDRLHELKFKKLGCFCKPKACHGDILKKYVDRLERDLSIGLWNISDH